MAMFNSYVSLPEGIWAFRAYFRVDISVEASRSCWERLRPKDLQPGLASELVGHHGDIMGISWGYHGDNNFNGLV